MFFIIQLDYIIHHIIMTMPGALAVICESLGEQLLEVVDQLVPSVLDSCQHEVDFVRLSAYVCMAHFAEHLAPAMQKHSRPVTLVCFFVCFERTNLN